MSSAVCTWELGHSTYSTVQHSSVLMVAAGRFAASLPTSLPGQALGTFPQTAERATKGASLRVRAGHISQRALSRYLSSRPSQAPMTLRPSTQSKSPAVTSTPIKLNLAIPNFEFGHEATGGPKGVSKTSASSLCDAPLLPQNPSGPRKYPTGSSHHALLAAQ
jgi:hypothetical protein